jgi:hypothetical protein
MWGTSSPDDERTGDFGNEIEVISISVCGLFRLLAENLSPGILGLLQHNRHKADKRESSPICLLCADIVAKVFLHW